MLSIDATQVTSKPKSEPTHTQRGQTALAARLVGTRHSVPHLGSRAGARSKLTDSGQPISLTRGLTYPQQHGPSLAKSQRSDTDMGILNSAAPKKSEKTTPKPENSSLASVFRNASNPDALQWQRVESKQITLAIPPHTNMLPPPSSSAPSSAIPATGQANKSIQHKITNLLTPLLDEITITDLSYINKNGLLQYKYDKNHHQVRVRRVEVAKKLGMNLSLAVSDSAFQLALADRVINERDNNNRMFGQCAEMAYVSASKVAQLAKESALNVYTLQLPDCNHTITLLSTSHYTQGQMINWQHEHAGRSLVIDLWQSAVSRQRGHQTVNLVSHSALNGYTKGNPRAMVQCKI